MAEASQIFQCRPKVNGIGVPDQRDSAANLECTPEHFSPIECSSYMADPNDTEQSVEVFRQEFSLAYCRAARALLDWSQVRLAAKANLSESTIRDFESGRRILRTERIAALRKAFESAGVTFSIGGPLLASTSAGVALSQIGGRPANAPKRDKGSAKRALKKLRSRPLKGEDAEVKHIVEMHDISPVQARELVRRHGNDWRKIEEAAKSYKIKKEGPVESGG